MLQWVCSKETFSAQHAAFNPYAVHKGRQQIDNIITPSYIMHADKHSCKPMHGALVNQAVINCSTPDQTLRPPAAAGQPVCAVPMPNGQHPAAGCTLILCWTAALLLTPHCWQPVLQLAGSLEPGSQRCRTGRCRQECSPVAAVGSRWQTAAVTGYSSSTSAPQQRRMQNIRGPIILSFPSQF